MTFSNSLIKSVAEFCRLKQLLSQGERILVGVSGGVDSMVLLDVLLQLKSEWDLQLAVVHVNHQLRGAESFGDEELVRRSAEHHQLAFFCERVDTLRLKHSMAVSTQVAAREARYKIYEEIREKTKSDHVATGHNADDNAETVLFNALRGTRLHGLAGIPIVRNAGQIVRPLLFARRKDILSYANERGIHFRNDSSNQSVAYSRNYLRHLVVPFLTDELGPDVIGSLNRVSNVTRKLSSLLDKLVDDHLPLVLRFTVAECEIMTPSFSNEPVFIKEEIIIRALRHLRVEPSGQKVNDVLALCSKQTGHCLHLNGRILVCKERDRLIFTEGFEPKNFTLDVSLGQTYSFDHYTLSLGQPGPVPTVFPGDGRTEYIDGDKIKLPLTVRNWKPGDWFVPLGMSGRKKLSDFFNDAKISHPDKINAPVLASNGNIVWVCGKRLDNRFRVTRTTRNAIRLLFSSTAHPVI